MTNTYVYTMYRINIYSDIFSYFYFLITYGVCKKKKYCNRISEKKKKNSLLLTNVHDLYVLEDKTSQKNFRLSVCRSVWMYVRTWTYQCCYKFWL